ncbi:Two-component response regulator [Arcticibacter svalbardensis MN12-7]|uniref:Two-component response regulator n=1 Tax=Arcticibacter svalbardensis MN12-7 TaxID=1150600 RepID=R9GQB0_9SPHI|nr:LytTR family DNA-binding domain-containing protein [Arcticibacter svalbardensis]EOR93908.1 Two-component response regulator [Arcticibacter svalbardensis MN12-7]
MVLHAIIVDDEEYSRKSLYFLIQEHCPDVQVDYIAQSVQQAREYIAKHPVNLAFLDIAMPCENGFELFSTLHQEDIMVIFTTAYDQYALKAIKANALDYLLKPIDIDELKESVQKAVKLNELIALKKTGGTPSHPGLLAENTKDINWSSKITIPHTHGYNVIDIKDIMYVEADSNYSIFHLKTSEKIITSKPLKEFVILLEANGFMRIHKSIILNFNFLKEYSNKNGLQVVLKNDTYLPVSRRKSNEFQEKSKLYFKKNT